MMLVMLSCLVLVLAIAICIMLGEFAPSSVSFLWPARQGADRNLAQEGFFMLIAAAVLFLVSWRLEQLLMHWNAICTYTATFSLAAMASHLILRSPSFHASYLTVCVVSISCFVLGGMILIVLFELPHLRVGGRVAVRRLVIMLALFDSMLLLVMLLVLGFVEFLWPGRSTQPLMLAGACLLGAGMGFSQIGWSDIAGACQFQCFFMRNCGLCAVGCGILQWHMPGFSQILAGSTSFFFALGLTLCGVGIERIGVALCMVGASLNTFATILWAFSEV
mmetsp:Transcript_23818/g.38913  ORF Transcript_23818/g.38913 Transcript_23818/m.38913 type:complete len:277 (+) Transcript_23818:3-833(+)